MVLWLYMRNLWIKNKQNMLPSKNYVSLPHVKQTI